MEEQKENKVQIVLFWIAFGIFLFATLLSLIRINYGNVAQSITYGLATIVICPITLTFINKKMNRNIKWYFQLILTILIIIIGSMFFNNNVNILEDIKKEIVTAENYEQLMEKWEKALDGKKEDDIYYFTYSTIYYMTNDGFASIFSLDASESDMYKNIYGKTIQQLINEGKQLMKNNNMTLEEMKQEVDNLSN